jgi:hypothetical protein
VLSAMLASTSGQPRRGTWSGNQCRAGNCTNFLLDGGYLILDEGRLAFVRL